MPEILFESEYRDPKTNLPGLLIRKNSKNKFAIASLYFFADPSKRSEEWQAEAFAGMTPAGVRKEYYIDYTAMAGQKIFPEFFEHEAKIIVPPVDLDPSEYAFFAGFDYGPRNPSSFHIYARHKNPKPEEPWLVVHEQYEPCPNIPEFAEKMKAHKYFPYIKYIAADPDLWSARQHVKAGNPISINQLFINEGVVLFTPGVRDEEAWIAEMHRHWMAEVPTFQIFSSCFHLIDEIKNAVYEDPKSLDKNLAYSDRMADRYNHALDDCKYFINSIPMANLSERKVTKYPIMVNKWKN
jgi:hypothetical protein